MVMNISSRKSAAGTARYFEAEERAEGRLAFIPQWLGKGAEYLGLRGAVDMDVFAKLLKNRMPDGKTKVRPKDRKNGVVATELVFNSPKGVSLAAELSPEADAIRQAFIDSVQETIAQRVEPIAAVRERAGGKDHDLTTGNVVGSLYIHSVNRDQEIHLHGHAVLQNLTKHPTENRFKALSPFRMFKQAPDIEADFLQRFRGKLHDLGFKTEDIEPDDPKSKAKYWDLKGVPEQTKERHGSRRGAIVNLYESTKAKGKQVGPKLRDKSGIMTRKAKAQVIDLDALRKKWRAELSPSEIDAFKHLKDSKVVPWNEFVARAKRHHALVRSAQYEAPSVGREKVYERAR